MLSRLIGYYKKLRCKNHGGKKEGGVEAGEEKNWDLKAVNIFNKNIEIFAKLQKYMIIQIQQTSRIPSRQDHEKKTDSHHNITKTLNIQTKERILKAARKKHQATCKARIM